MKNTVNIAIAYFAMLSPLKNRAMSWSEDCHGNPLALITVLSHTFSILLLHTDISTAGVDLELIFRGRKQKRIFILSKLYLPSASLKLLTDSLLARKRVGCNGKAIEFDFQN